MGNHWSVFARDEVRKTDFKKPEEKLGSLQVNFAEVLERDNSDWI